MSTTASTPHSHLLIKGQAADEGDDNGIKVNQVQAVNQRLEACEVGVRLWFVCVMLMCWAGCEYDR